MTVLRTSALLMHLSPPYIRLCRFVLFWFIICPSGQGEAGLQCSHQEALPTLGDWVALVQEGAGGTCLWTHTR